MNTPCICPHCGQSMRTYRRHIRPSQILALNKMKDLFGFSPCKSVEIDERANKISDFTKLNYWGLIAPDMENPNHWKLTDKGAMFLEGRISITKYRWIYNGKVMNEPDGVENPLIKVWDIEPTIVSRETSLKASESAKGFEQNRDLFGMKPDWMNHL